MHVTAKALSPDDTILVGTFADGPNFKILKRIPDSYPWVSVFGRGSHKERTA